MSGAKADGSQDALGGETGTGGSDVMEAAESLRGRDLQDWGSVVSSGADDRLFWVAGESGTEKEPDWERDLGVEAPDEALLPALK